MILPSYVLFIYGVARVLAALLLAAARRETGSRSQDHCDDPERDLWRRARRGGDLGSDG